MSEPPFEKRRGPGAPVHVTLGAMNFGKRTGEAEALRIVDRAFERGVRLVDTANVYENGASERIVARALAARRGALSVATKVGLGRVGGRAEGLAPDVVRRAFEASRERLGVDVVDVYYLHAPDHAEPIERTLEAVLELVQAGKVRGFGVSNYASWQVLEIVQRCAAVGAAGPVVAQQMYNLLVRQLDIEYFRFAAKYALPTTTYNALAGGLLARPLEFGAVPKGSRFDGNAMYRRRYWSRAFFEAVERYRALAADSGRSLASFAYGFLAARADVDSVLVGPATVLHLDEALDALERPLDSATMARIDEIAHDLTGTDAVYAR